MTGAFTPGAHTPITPGDRARVRLDLVRCVVVHPSLKYDIESPVSVWTSSAALGNMVPDYTLILISASAQITFLGPVTASRCIHPAPQPRLEISGIPRALVRTKGYRTVLRPHRPGDIERNS